MGETVFVLQRSKRKGNLERIKLMGSVAEIHQVLVHAWQMITRVTGRLVLGNGR
jgi:hypothetical protein